MYLDVGCGLPPATATVTTSASRHVCLLFCPSAGLRRSECGARLPLLSAARKLLRKQLRVLLHHLRLLPLFLA